VRSGPHQGGPLQGYKPYYLARKYGITLKLARILIKRTGRDRVKLNKAAKGLARKRTKAAEA
jgi:hypothetical protein